MSESRPQILADLSSSSRVIEAKDDHRHPAPAEDLLWAETAWWVFIDPESGLSGWFYLLTRPNLNIASLGVWVWDGGSSDPWALPYSKSLVHIPLPGDYDLTDLPLDAHGFRLRTVEPLSSYEIRYDDPGLFAANLRFTATAPPQPMGVGDQTGHFDQPLWVTGEIRLGDAITTLDAPGFRDRTWSTRPETATPRANCYSWATARDRSFQLLSMLDDEGSPVFTGGYLLRDGESAPLVKADRRVTERADDGRPLSLEVDLTDALGRTSRAVGRCTSTAALPGFAGYLTFASAVQWELDGETVVGEDHDSWPHHRFRARFA